MYPTPETSALEAARYREPLTLQSESWARSPRMSPERARELGRVVSSIYAIMDPREGQVAYVGRTLGTLRRRFVQHLAAARAGSALPIHWWIRDLWKDGEDPWTELLETVDEQGHNGWPCADGNAAAREAHWIRFHVRGDGLLQLQRTGYKRHKVPPPA